MREFLWHGWSGAITMYAWLLVGVCTLFTSGVAGQELPSVTPAVSPTAATPTDPVPPVTPPATTPTVPDASVTPTPAAPDQVSADALKSLLTKIEAASDLSDEKKEREKARALITKGLDDLRIVGDSTEQERAFAEKLKTVTERRDAAERMQRLERRVEQPWIGSGLENLERTLAEKQQQLAQKQAELTEIDNRIAGREERKKVLRQIIADAPKKLSELATRMQSPGNPADPALVQDAVRLSLLAERRRVEKEPTTAQSELALYDAEDALSLLTLERIGPANEVSALKQEVEAWTKAVTARRKKDAESRLTIAQANVDNSQSPLREIYQQAAKYAEREIQVRRQRSEYQEGLDKARAQREQLERELQVFQEREKRSKDSVVLGIRLRKQRRLLPSVPGLQNDRRKRIEVMETTQVDYLDLLEEQADTATIEARVSQLIAVSTSPLDDEEDQIQFQQRARNAFTDQKDCQDAMLKAYVESVDTLEQLDSEQGRLIELSGEFEKYINERVLWIRSHRPISLHGLTRDTDSLQQLFSPVYWREFCDFLLTDTVRAPWWYVFFVVCFLTLVGTHKLQRRAIRQLGSRAQSRLNTAMTPTWQALLWTILLAILVPLPLLFLGWRMGDYAATVLTPETATSAERHWLVLFSEWLWLFGQTMLGLELARNVCRIQGLGEAHFGWPKRAMELVVGEVRRFELLVIPIVLILSLLHSQGADGTEETLEQVIAITCFVLLAILLHRLTRPSTGVLQEWLERFPNAWLGQLSVIWHLMAIGIPLSLAGLTGLGYHYTSGRLALKLGQSLLLIFGAAFIRALVIRGLTLRQRRLAVEQARGRRAAADGRDPEGVPAPAPIGGTNLATMSVQTRRLLDTTMLLACLFLIWQVWDDVLPALRYFDRWTVPGLPVTYAAAGLAVLIAVLTGTAARNVPGLLEMLLLERLPIDRSVRYAIASIVRYVIVLLGILSVSDTLGVDWENVQWLAAALTFGLGFGLQEIFANFVSGLIILFEQPVRVGDVVTIDGVSGVVSQIRIRSTTITDWDRKEYIVPNKEFITGRLLNWTLNDTVNRLKVAVGVAYGSDPNKVREILIAVVTSHPHILVEPPPMVVFDGFGDSALNFTVRVFLPTIEHRLPTTNSLHLEIYHALQAAGIEIPFPQQDIHIRSMPRSLSDELTQANQHDSLETA